MLFRYSLSRIGLAVGEMHSDLDQVERDEVMLDFKNGKKNILVATDIVSRGIDIEGVDVVINYDVPHDVEDYIHRIGRTARANREGTGLTFVSEKEQDKFAKIEKFLEKTIFKHPIPLHLGEAPEYNPIKNKGGRGGFGNKKRSRNTNYKNNRKKPVVNKKSSDNK